MGQLEKMQQDITMLLQIVSKLSRPAPTLQREERLYERKDAAAFLRVSLTTLDRMTREGVVKCYRVGDTDQKRFKYSELLAVLVPVGMEEMVG